MTELIVTLAFLTCSTFTVTPYAPSLGGVNGGTTTANGTVLAPEHHLRTAACGRSYPFGTVFKLAVPGLGPLTVTCNDRGGLISNTHLDLLVLTGEGPKKDWQVAKLIAKRRLTVCVYSEANR